MLLQATLADGVDGGCSQVHMGRLQVCCWDHRLACHLDMGPPSQNSPLWSLAPLGFHSLLPGSQSSHKGTFDHGQLPNYCCWQEIWARDLLFHHLLMLLQSWFSLRGVRDGLFSSSVLAFDAFLAIFHLPWLICALRFIWLFSVCVLLSLNFPFWWGHQSYWKRRAFYSSMTSFNHLELQWPCLQISSHCKVLAIKTSIDEC